MGKSEEHKREGRVGPTEGFRTTAAGVGERIVDLGVALLAMVVVERFYREEGLGVYSFALAVYVLGSSVFDMGLSRDTGFRVAGSYGEDERAGAVREGMQGIVFTGIVAFVLLSMFEGYASLFTRASDNPLVYPLLGVAIAFHNVNRLRIAVLHGLGMHERAVSILVKKRLVFLGALLALASVKVSPSFLVGAFVVAELAAALAARHDLQLPGFRTLFQRPGRLIPTLRDASGGFLTEDAMGILLFIDLFVLGVFVDSSRLGVYAEALVVGKLFLLVPGALVPILKTQYALWAGSGSEKDLRDRVPMFARGVVLVHSMLAMYAILFFPKVLNALFRINVETTPAFTVFALTVPGFLLYGAIATIEPLYEAEGRKRSLQALVVGVLVGNLALNLYLVPFAGIFGAAASTSLSLLGYFLCLGKDLPVAYRIVKAPYLVSVASLYVCYVLVKALPVGGIATAFIIPPLVCVMFGFSGFFGMDALRQSTGTGEALVKGEGGL